MQTSTLLLATLTLYLYDNPPMHCDKRTQWIKDGQDKGWFNPVMGLCSNLQDANWNDIDLPPYSAGLKNSFISSDRVMTIQSTGNISEVNLVKPLTQLSNKLTKYQGSEEFH